MAPTTSGSAGRARRRTSTRPSAWRERCEPLDDVVSLVTPGAHIFVGTGSATPLTLLAELEKQHARLAGIQLVSFLTNGMTAETGLRFNQRVFYLGRDMRGVDRDRLEYVPLPLMDVPALIRSRRIRLDVAFIQVSPPDSGGMCSLGVSVDVTLAAVQAAGLVVAEINPDMPRTGRHAVVPFSQLDAVVFAQQPLSEFRYSGDDAVGERISRYVARLVDDGACLQVGLGPIPSAVLSHLGSRRNLGMHTDVLGDTAVPLIESGVINGRRKVRSKGKVVASFALGTETLFECLRQHSDTIVLRPIDQVCDAEVLTSERKVVSINQAHVVDLTGQGSAEGRGDHSTGGVATASAFHRAATGSPEGRAIVCLSSRTPEGRPAVVCRLGRHEPVTLARWAVHWVVTEYGSAYLMGKSERERAVALIELAHPDDRAGLLTEAKRVGLLPMDQTLRSRRDYPVEEERIVTLRDGTDVLIRPTRTSDAGLLQEMFFRLSAEDVRTRFFRRLSSLTRKMAEHLCSVSYEEEMAFAAVVGDAEHEQIVGTSSYFVDPATGLADVAYMVDADWQGRGLGTALHRVTSDYAQRTRVIGFTADVLIENDPMLRIFADSDGDLSVETADGVSEFVLRFAHRQALRPAGSAATEEFNEEDATGSDPDFSRPRGI